MNTLFGRARYRRSVTAAAVVAMIAAVSAPAAAHHGHHSLSGKGTMTVSDQSVCGPDDCYMVSLDFPAKGGSNNPISATATGQGMTDPSTCKSKDGSSCCTTAITLTFTFDQNSTPIAGIDCVFAGTECEKPANSPTSAKFKGTLQCMDGTGEIAGATGSGKLSADVSTGTGEGPASASIHLKK
ncbi:MAG TPA: hypothetical protein VEY94_00300 [Patescibacteria group bacterium]|nr:hypothetical protein [Patescibacteria group bacterium]